MIDDQFQVNSKSQKLAQMALEGDPMGVGAIGLWTLAGSRCQAALTDGVTSIKDLVSLILNHAMALKLADLLVDAGLWHKPGHDCERCPEVAPNTWLYHDWFKMKYSTGAQVRLKNMKAAELKDREIIAAVWARDCVDPARPTTAKCRYCGELLNKKVTRGATRHSMDHVDPFLAVGARNIVLCCLDCNQKKGQRLPGEAEMTLRPAPPHSRAAESVETASPTTVAAEAKSPESPRTMDEHARTSAGPLHTEPPKPGDSSPPNPGPLQIPAQGAVPPARGHTRALAGQGGAGQGNEQVKPTTDQPEPANKSRRRSNRSRKRGQRGRNPQPPNHDAGPTPVVPVAGIHGSPWKNWTCKPSDVTETTCPDHGIEMPCRKCLENTNDTHQ